MARIRARGYTGDEGSLPSLKIEMQGSCDGDRFPRK